MDSEQLFQGDNDFYTTERNFGIDIPSHHIGLGIERGLTPDLLREVTKEAVTRVSRLFGIREEDIPIDKAKARFRRLSDRIFDRHTGAQASRTDNAIQFNLDSIRIAREDNQNIKWIRSSAFREVAHLASNLFTSDKEFKEAMSRYGEIDGFILMELPALAADYDASKEYGHLEDLKDDGILTIANEIISQMREITTSKDKDKARGLIYSDQIKAFAYLLLKKYGSEKLCRLCTHADIKKAFKSEYGKTWMVTLLEICQDYGISRQEFLQLYWINEQDRKLTYFVEDLGPDSNISWRIWQDSDTAEDFTPKWANQHDGLRMRSWVTVKKGNSTKLIFLQFQGSDGKVRASIGSNSDAIKDKKSVFEFDDVLEVFGDERFLTS